MFYLSQTIRIARATVCGIIGGVFGAALYFLFAFIYAIVNSRIAPQNDSWITIRFMPSEEDLVLGVTLCTLIGFMLGVCCSRCLGQSNHVPTTSLINSSMPFPTVGRVAGEVPPGTPVSGTLVEFGETPPIRMGYQTL